MSHPVPDLPGYLARWAPLHGMADPPARGLVLGWLGVSYRCARPLAAAGVAPDLLTGAAVLLAAGAPVAAAGGLWWCLAAAALLVAALVVDGLDGAVALLTDRAGPRGFVLDSLADRVADGLGLLALWAAGGSAGPVVGAGAAAFLLEYARARAGSAGFHEIGQVTVGERPTRVVLAALGLAAAALPAAGGDAATGAAAAVLAVSAAGCVQLAAVLWRRLPASSGRWPDHPRDDLGGEQDEGQAPTGVR